MGTSENAETIRRGYDAFNAGDMDTLTQIFDERASWHTPGRGALAGDRDGRDETFTYFGRLAQETGGSFRADLQHLATDDEGRVIGVHRVIGDRDGKHLDVECCLVFEFEDGRVIDGREHFEDLYAWDEFWS